MQSRLALHPDVVESMLEGRILMDASQRPPRATPPVAPMVLTTSGFVILPAASAAFALTSGAVDPIGGNGNYGLNMAAKFYMTGFGLSVMKIGSASGDPALGAVDPATFGTTNSTYGGVPASLNPTVNVGPTPANPAGQSLPLNPGSGFLYIGQSHGSILPGGPTLGRTLPTHQPYAPLGPITPNEPTQALPETPGEGETNPPDSGAKILPKARDLETSTQARHQPQATINPGALQGKSNPRPNDTADDVLDSALLEMPGLDLTMAPSDSMDFADPTTPKPNDWPKPRELQTVDAAEFATPMRGLLYLAGTTPITPSILPDGRARDAASL